MQRRKFLKQGAFGVLGFTALPEIIISQQNKRPPALESAVVKEFVQVAHTDLEKVKVMLEQYPLLLNASWDWGGGDFETALGAAGHMGLPETANYLLSKGARVDIFVLTMLGKTEIVKSMLADYPILLDSLGPHGFTLLHHAEKGGSEASELKEFLLNQGLKEKHIKLY